MHPYSNGDGPFMKQPPLTMEMLVAEPPPYLTDVEEMLIEQRGLREVNQILIIIYISTYFLSFPFLEWTRVAEEFV